MRKGQDPSFPYLHSALKSCRLEFDFESEVELSLAFAQASSVAEVFADDTSKPDWKEAAALVSLVCDGLVVDAYAAVLVVPDVSAAWHAHMEDEAIYLQFQVCSLQA